ncbi:MAG: tRNA-dihydrouridine synthase [Patescibacteria group bacterium]
MKNFWTKLQKPIFCLAPMADVTDCAFRQIIAKYGKPDIFWTEFVSADGLCSAGRKKLLIDLKYSENERPIVAQIFGSKPENIKKASALCKKLGFDGLDINMGCPDKFVEKQYSGAAMMKNPKLARECIRAAIEGGEGLPVSVKTRIGYNKNEIETWIPELLKEDLAALIVHLRTRQEMSDVPAHWNLMKRIVEIRNKTKKKTLILGNGDVINTDDGRRKCLEFGCDGVMLGRAIFGNPWLFTQCQRDTLTQNSMSKCLFDIVLQEKLKVMVEHTKLFEKMLGADKNFAIMKKHYKAYANGFDGAKLLRIKLMETENASQVENIVNDFLRKI